MQITRVDFSKNTEEGSLLGKVSITLDYDFVVKNIKVMQGKKGLYLVFPTDRTGRFLAFPSTEEFRQKILQEVKNKLEICDE